MMRKARVGLDIKILGGLFLTFGTVDLVVIDLFPSYAFKLFGVAVTGPSSYLVKLHSPAVHLLIGYGFLWLRPWAWGLSVAYAGFGLVSETMDQLSFGFHPVRSGFMATTMLFVAYVIWNRTLFSDEDLAAKHHTPVSEELH